MIGEHFPKVSPPSRQSLKSYNAKFVMDKCARNKYGATLRRSNDFSLIRYNSLLGRNSVRYRGPIIWNSIPRNIRNAASLQLFKATLKRASKSIDQIQFEKEACLLNSKDPNFVYF